MSISLHVAMLGTLATACVVADEPMAIDDDVHGVDIEELATESDPDVCGLLPACGPCSLACDPVALAEQYLPPNTCATLRCELTTGQAISVHACNVGDD